MKTWQLKNTLATAEKISIHLQEQRPAHWHGLPFLNEDQMHVLPDEARSDLCDGLNIFMLYGPLRTRAMKLLHTMNLQSLDEFEHVYTSQPPRVDVAEIRGGEARESRLVA